MTNHYDSICPDSDGKTVEIRDFKIETSRTCGGSNYTIKFYSPSVLTDREIGLVVKEVTVPQIRTVKIKY